MRYFDSNPAVLKWASEEFSIPYIKPTDMRVHQYFPDFVIVYKNKAGAIVKEILEIKPLKESLHENAKSEHDKIALAINIAKWQAADAFATKHGMKFRVITEKSLFVQGPAKKKQSARRKVPVRKK